ncbi:MAG: PAS domain-containing protein, partial [Omnitrophica WOR_2 bacterium]
MSKKKLLKQLENLLVDLEQEVSLLPAPGEKSVPGWTWECDSNGCFISCSPEVEAILGISPQEFYGQSLVRYALLPEYIDLVEDSLGKSESPVELDVQYAKAGGEPVLVKLRIIS